MKKLYYAITMLLLIVFANALNAQTNCAYISVGAESNETLSLILKVIPIELLLHLTKLMTRI